MKKYFPILWVLCLIAQVSQAQIYSNASARPLVEQTLKEIYNFDAEKAETHIADIKGQLPNHPIAPLLSALNLYWKHFPLEPGNPAFQTYNGYLQQALQQAQALMKDEKTRTEGMFFALSVHGYRSMAESDAGNSVGALKESKKAFGYMKQGFKLKDQYPEFYLSTGLYNFYVEQYPEDHPMVRPLMWFFPDGNKDLGLQQLEAAAQKGIFTKTEALYYLVFIHQKYQSNGMKALAYSRQLINQYPHNLLFVTRHVESLLACGKYADAQPFIDQLLASKQKAFLASGHIFQGVVQEKHQQNLAAAKTSYHRALQLSPGDKSFTKEFYAWAYAGLGRIASQEGNGEMAKSYYKKSLDTAEYKATVKEVKGYLKS